MSDQFALLILCFSSQGWILRMPWNLEFASDDSLLQEGQRVTSSNCHAKDDGTYKPSTFGQSAPARRRLRRLAVRYLSYSTCGITSTPAAFAQRPNTARAFTGEHDTWVYCTLYFFRTACFCRAYFSPLRFDVLPTALVVVLQIVVLFFSSCMSSKVI